LTQLESYGLKPGSDESFAERALRIPLRVKSKFNPPMPDIGGQPDARKYSNIPFSSTDAYPLCPRLDVDEHLLPLS
jgi:hypothetical protein